jgi:hypothetical protein
MSQVRESAILALGAVSEGCHLGLAPYLNDMVKMLVPVLQVRLHDLSSTNVFLTLAHIWLIPHQSKHSMMLLNCYAVANRCY